jgi:hypothetical protein
MSSHHQNPPAKSIAPPVAFTDKILLRGGDDGGGATAIGALGGWPPRVRWETVVVGLGSLLSLRESPAPPSAVLAQAALPWPRQPRILRRQYTAVAELNVVGTAQ